LWAEIATHLSDVRNDRVGRTTIKEPTVSGHGRLLAWQV